MYISKRNIKKIFSENTQSVISADVVKYLQKYLEDTFKALMWEIINEQDNFNALRKLHGLPPLKRITLFTLKSIMARDLIANHFFMIEGEEGQSDKDTSLSEAEAIEVA